MKTNRALLISSASLLILFGVPNVFGQTSKASSSNQKSIANENATKVLSDASFAKEANEGGLAEVKLGQLAEDKGSSPGVKDFGKRMVSDHTKADDQLKSAASTDKITLPNQINERDQATYNRLSKLSGTAFDRAYARDMVRDHETDVALFQREAKSGKNESIKTFASETLPTLQDHLKQARQMEQSVSTRPTSGAPKHTS